MCSAQSRQVKCAEALCEPSFIRLRHDVTSRTKERSGLQGGNCSDWSIMTKTRFRPVTSSRIATMRLERYSFCPARRILESASPDIQYEWTFWINTKVVDNAQDFRAIKYGGASNQVVSSNPPYDPLSTSNQGVSSNQPYNSQFIKETPR